GYVYEEEQGDDNSKTTEYPHTVVVARLPETLGFLGELTVEPRDRFDPFGRIGDRLRKRRRVEFESIELDRLFEVTVPRDADDNWVRQLFSPSFVDWLGTAAPRQLGFELQEGVLCISIPREMTDPSYLEGFCRTASYIAARFRQEALEIARRPASTRFAERPVAAVAVGPVAALAPGGRAPTDVTEAARPFFGVAAREPATWRNPLFFAGIAFVAGVAWVSDETSSIAVEVGTGVVAAVVVLVLTLRVAIRQ